MKKIAILFTIVFVIFLSNRSFGQHLKYIDSLKKHLPSREDDSVKVGGYADISWFYMTSKSNLQDTAKMYVDTVLRISKEIDHQYGIALSDLYFGMINRRKGNFKTGIDQVQNFVDYHEKRGDSLRVAAGLYQIGVMNSYLGNYEKALGIYQRTIDIYKREKNAKRVANLLHSTAHIQRKIGKYDKAISNYTEAINILKEINYVTGISMSTESLGNTYGELEEYDKAENYLLKALDIVNGEKRPIGIASVNENLGNLYAKMKNYEKSLKHHLESLKIREAMASKKNLALSLTKVGAIYSELGKNTKAEAYLNKGLAIAEEHDLKPVLEENYKVLSEHYTRTQDFKKALTNQKSYAQIKDSILDIEKNKQLLELETRYETAEKDNEIKLLTKEKEIQEARAEKQATLKNALIAGVALLAVIAGLVFYVMRQRLKNQKTLAAKNEEIKISNLREQLGTLEMKALRAQMNPHFLFNCMNSINRMILSNDNKNASKYLTKFSKLVRLMLENSEAQKVPLEDELQMLKSYIELESIRFKGKID